MQDVVISKNWIFIQEPEGERNARIEKNEIRKNRNERGERACEYEFIRADMLRMVLIRWPCCVSSMMLEESSWRETHDAQRRRHTHKQVCDRLCR